MSQTVALGPIPLDKYSYALSNENVRHHIWSHDTRRELLQLKVVRVGSSIGLDDGGLQILVVAGNECLERLDAEALVRWAREHEQKLRLGLVAAQTEPPVQVVVKFPCIAMRYPNQHPMVRRFQLKFRTEAEYLTVRDLFRDIGFPIKESSGTARPASRASAATPSSGITRLASSSPALGSLQRNTISHSQPALSFGSSSLHGYQFQPAGPSRTETSSALSMRPPSILSPDIERLRSSSAMEPSSGRSSPTNDFRFPPPPVRTHQSPPVFSQGQSSYGPQYGIHSSPLNPQQPEPPRANPDGTTLFQHSESQTVATRNSELNQVFGERHDSTLQSGPMAPYGENSSSQFFSAGMGLKRSSTALSLQVSNTHGYEPLNQTRHRSSLHESMHRPSSTPLTGAQYDTSRLDTSSWIPPKRDLPFPKPKEPKKAEVPAKMERRVSFSQEPEQEEVRRQRTISPELGSTTATPETLPARAKTPTPPPPPKPAAKPARKRPPTRKKTGAAAAALPREIPDSQERVTRTASALPDKPVSPLAARAAAIPRPSTAPPGKAVTQSRKRAADTNIAPPAKAVKMIDNSTQTQTGSGRSHTALPRSATVTQPLPPVEVEAPAAAARLTPAATPAPPVPQPARQPTEKEVDGIGDVMEKFISRMARPRRPLEIYEMPGWDEADEEERHAIVENWMIEQLQDPKFIELCRTMENVWQRTGIP